jgi:ABC-type oligopeptide transport system substrate-binding subunit
MKVFRLGLVILLICLLVTSVVAGAGAKERVVQLPYFDNIPSLAPYLWQQQHILAQGTIFEGLFGYAPDPKGMGGVKVVPVIADKWTVSEDGRVWTITLRKDKKWSNGDPITARDFEWTYKYLDDPLMTEFPVWASPVQHLKNGWSCKGGGVPIDQLGVKALDDYTIQFTTENPKFDFNCWLLVGGSMPLHRKTVEKWGDMGWWKPEHFVGNGPYIPISWTDRKELVLVKNKNYVGTPGKVDKFILKNFAVGASQIQAYQAGEIDMAWITGSNGAIADYKFATTNATLKKAYHETPADLTWAGYQVVRGFSDTLDNIKLRQAFAMAIDRATLAKTVLNGRAYPLAKYWPDNSNIGKAMKNIPFNVKAAQKLLAEAGYPGGKGLPPIKFYITGNMPEVEYVVDQWKKNLGVTVQMENVESGIYWQQYIWGWVPEAGAGFTRVSGSMNSFEAGGLSKGANQLFWGEGFSGAIKKASYDNEQLKIAFLTKEGGTTDADWEPLLARKTKNEAALKEIASKEPSKIWVLDLYTRKPTFNEQFDELYDKYKNAKTDKEKTEAWRLENRLLIDSDTKIMQYNAMAEAQKQAFRGYLESLNVPFDKAVELAPKFTQLLQDQYFMIPLYLEKYQYVLRPNITGLNVYKFAWGPAVFHLKYLDVK